MQLLTVKQTVFAGVSALGGILGQIFGPVNGAFIALVVFVIFDYLTGLAVAIKQKTISSKIGFNGIVKKLGIFVLVSICFMIDQYVLKTGALLRSACIFFYVANEGISVIENLSSLGLPIPPKVIEVLAQLNDKENEDSKQKGDCESCIFYVGNKCESGQDECMYYNAFQFYEDQSGSGEFSDSDDII